MKNLETPEKETISFLNIPGKLSLKVPATTNHLAIGQRMPSPRTNKAGNSLF